MSLQSSLITFVFLFVTFEMVCGKAFNASLELDGSEFEVEEAQNATQPDNRHHFFCHPCKKLFDELKHEVKDIEHLTEEQLKKQIHGLCDKLKIHLLEHVCKKLGDEAIKDLDHLISKEDKKIDSERCCKKIHLC